ncbi:MAG TPA: hypothetical protein VMN39_05010 [Longimicrobiaceae bacterium]|nr:hypothetical protein [Longimicrobiaceae bacterium]
MENPQIEEVRSSRVLQACLTGAVLLFVFLLAAMIVLAYLRFMERTDPAGPGLERTSSVAAPAAPATSAPLRVLVP